MTIQNPEKFVVGETVSFYRGEHVSVVTVFAVNGDEVTAGVHVETARVFVPRADGKHVAVDSLDTDIMPDMIFHTKEEEQVVKETFRDRLTDSFDRILDYILHPFF